MQRYEPKAFEPKWQKLWQESQIYKTDDKSSKKKSYVLDFFPYPSGIAMHMGHVRNYSISDVVSRYERMKGHEVLHPMGWDAFGLPAENFAIQNNISPRDAIDQNTDKFRDQFNMLGMSYDWSREIDSSDPDYYRWTQWFFLLLHKRGLAYRKEGLQNWCPKDKTVLANEQIIIENDTKVCERCGSAVEKKRLKQWFFKITDYAERLLADLEEINWPDRIKAMQTNWIGKSVGAEVDFKVEGSKDKIKIFTTRPDTLFGATYMVLAPEHPLVKKVTTKDQKSEVDAYLKEAANKTELQRKQDEKEKTGVFTGAYAINSVSNEKIPIWVADYVLMSYGTGAIMAVPAHDKRDNEFANKFNLPIKQVVAWREMDDTNPHQDDFDLVERETVVVHLKDKKTGKYALLNWNGTLKGTTTAIMGGVEEGQTLEEAALTEIKEEAGLEAKIIKVHPDLSISEYCASHKKENRRALARVAYAEVDDASKETEVSKEEKSKHTLIWVDKDKVEETLTPTHQKLLWSQIDQNHVYTGEGQIINSGKYNGMETSVMREQIVVDLTKEKMGSEQINYKLRDWLISRQRYWGAPIPIIHCEECGEVPVPEDQLPVELPEMKEFHPDGVGRGPLARVEDWVKVKCPKCDGDAKRETDTMDGFACSSWYFLRFADPHNSKAAFSKRMSDEWLPVDTYIGGAEHAVMHLLYARFWTKVMHDEGLIDFDEPFTQLRNQGMLLAEDGRKISKRLKNYVAPEKLIKDGYGADALRTTVLFLAPYDQETPWSNQGLVGVYRFLNRVWDLGQEVIHTKPDDSVETDSELITALQSRIHKTTKKVTSDLEDMKFNTAISAIMELMNELDKFKKELPVDHALRAWRESIAKTTLLLAPFAPHMCEEIWSQLGNKTSVHVSPWPTWDDGLVRDDLATIVIQINGKVRANITMEADVSEEDMVDQAKSDEKIAEYLSQGKLVKTIAIPAKLVNFVIKS